MPEMEEDYDILPRRLSDGFALVDIPFLKCKWNFSFRYNAIKREGLYPMRALLSAVALLLL